MASPHLGEIIVNYLSVTLELSKRIKMSGKNKQVTCSKKGSEGNCPNQHIVIRYVELSSSSSCPIHDYVKVDSYRIIC